MSLTLALALLVQAPSPQAPTGPAPAAPPAVPPATAPPPRCPASPVAELRRLLATGAYAEVVVFSPWCAPCREHLLGAGRHTLLVGAFDSTDRLGAVVTSTAAPEVRCISGDALARALGALSVPKVLARGRGEWPAAAAGPPLHGG